MECIRSCLHGTSRLSVISVEALRLAILCQLLRVTTYKKQCKSLVSLPIAKSKLQASKLHISVGKWHPDYQDILLNKESIIQTLKREPIVRTKEDSSGR